MPELSVAFFGDIVGSPGRSAVAHAIPRLRDSHNIQLVIANAENARNGSGCSPDNYRELKRAGVNVFTLGDHVYKDRGIVELLENVNQPIARPANLAPGAPGKRITIIDDLAPVGRPRLPPIAVITVLGRVYMPLPSDNPFAAIDSELTQLAAQPLGERTSVIVEVHGEVTSEKQAIAWHCLERWNAPGAPGPTVVAVVGTHTHVQTADARILEHRLAAITDLGMTGPHRGVIGRDARATVLAMAHQAPTPLEVADGDNRASGVVLRLDPIVRRAAAIEPFSVACPDY
jgi:2',3'-cyclic-nucleotide 2'-phosphodiesterase